MLPSWRNMDFLTVKAYQEDSGSSIWSRRYHVHFALWGVPMHTYWENGTLFLSSDLPLAKGKAQALQTQPSSNIKKTPPKQTKPNKAGLTFATKVHSVPTAWQQNKSFTSSHLHTLPSLALQFSPSAWPSSATTQMLALLVTYGWHQVIPLIASLQQPGPCTAVLLHSLEKGNVLTQHRFIWESRAPSACSHFYPLPTTGSHWASQMKGSSKCKLLLMNFHVGSLTEKCTLQRVIFAATRPWHS